MNKFDTIYKNLLKDILENGIEETSQRQNCKTKAIPGQTFSIDIENDGFPLLSLRKIPIKMFIAEQIWFLSGARKPDHFLREYTKIWDSFTNPAGVVTVAYGYRWRKYFGRDQIKSLLNLLKKDSSSRHGVIITWDPASDGLDGAKRMNVPCPYSFTVNIIGGKLHLHNIVRSNDMILGCPADVAGFALLQCILSQELGVRPGIYTHTVSNAHIYDTHYDIAREIISRESNQNKIVLELPNESFERAEKRDRELVEEIAKILETQYKPQEAIKGIKIVL